MRRAQVECSFVSRGPCIRTSMRPLGVRVGPIAVIDIIEVDQNHFAVFLTSDTTVSTGHDKTCCVPQSSGIVISMMLAVFPSNPVPNEMGPTDKWTLGVYRAPLHAGNTTRGLLNKALYDCIKPHRISHLHFPFPSAPHRSLLSFTNHRLSLHRRCLTLWKALGQSTQCCSVNVDHRQRIQQNFRKARWTSPVLLLDPFYSPLTRPRHQSPKSERPPISSIVSQCFTPGFNSHRTLTDVLPSSTHPSLSSPHL